MRLSPLHALLVLGTVALGVPVGRARHSGIRRHLGARDRTSNGRCRQQPLHVDGPRRSGEDRRYRGQDGSPGAESACARGRRLRRDGSLPAADGRRWCVRATRANRIWSGLHFATRCKRVRSSDAKLPTTSRRTSSGCCTRMASANEEPRQAGLFEPHLAFAGAGETSQERPRRAVHVMRLSTETRVAATAAASRKETP